MNFIPRNVKAGWGLPCNQSADGQLWAGKGYELPLSGQFGEAVASKIRRAIAAVRGDRCGRFWVNLETNEITMAVGESSDNVYEHASF